MHVWIVVVALLTLAVLFLFISLFLKDNQYEDELDELSEGLLELNREVYSLKKKIQELEGTPIYRAPVETEAPTSFTQTVVQPVVPETPTPSFTPVEETSVAPETFELSEEELHEITRKHILTLFSHGGSYEQIAEQLNVPVATVQATIDSYFDSSRG